MAPRMERFRFFKVVTVSSTDGPTVHPRRPDCPSWAARLPAWQAPTAHRSVGLPTGAVGRLPCVSATAARGGSDCRGDSRAAHRSVGLPTRSVGLPTRAVRLPKRAVELPTRAVGLPPASVATDGPDCPLTRRDCPRVSRKSPLDCPRGRPRLPIELGWTAHVSRVGQPESAARLSVCQLDCPLTTLGRRDHLLAAGS